MKSLLAIYPGSIVSEELCIRKAVYVFLMRAIRDISPFRKQRSVKKKYWCCSHF